MVNLSKTKVVVYETTREISYIPLGENFVVFKEQFFVNGDFSLERQGITFLYKVLNVNTTELIDKHNNFFLFKKEIMEVIPKNAFDSTIYLGYLIKDAYDHICLSGLNDSCLLGIYNCDHSIRDLTGKKIPVPMHFDYTSGFFSNEIYNLETCLEILLQRNDITINKNKFGHMIQDIPSWNSDEDKSHYIDFLWHPTTKDFEKISSISSSLSRYSFVCDNILKLPRK